MLFSQPHAQTKQTDPTTNNTTTLPNQDHKSPILQPEVTMEWAKYLTKGADVKPNTTSITGDDCDPDNTQHDKIIIDIQDNGVACKAALEKHLQKSEQEWGMFLEICLKFQLRQQNKPTAGLKNLESNLLRILKIEQVMKEEVVLVSIIEGSLYYMRAVLVNSEAFIGYPMEMLEGVISRIAVVMLDIKKTYLEE